MILLTVTGSKLEKTLNFGSLYHGNGPGNGNGHVSLMDSESDNF